MCLAKSVGCFAVLGHAEFVMFPARSDASCTGSVTGQARSGTKLVKYTEVVDSKKTEVSKLSFLQ